MCVRLVLALLLLASCGSCVDRDCPQLDLWDRYIRPKGFDLILGPSFDNCPKECTYEVTGATLSVADLADHINDFCLDGTGCSVSVTGTPETILTLSACCDCLTVVVERSGPSGKSTAMATIWASIPQDFATSPFTDSFTVGP